MHRRSLGRDDTVGPNAGICLLGSREFRRIPFLPDLEGQAAVIGFSIVEMKIEQIVLFEAIPLRPVWICIGKGVRYQQVEGIEQILDLPQVPDPAQLAQKHPRPQIELAERKFLEPPDVRGVRSSSRTSGSL